MPSEPILSGQVYPDLKIAELDIYQVNINVSFVAAFELRDMGGSTQLKAWAPKPSFGSGYSFLAAASVKLAELGDKSGCEDFGF